MRAPAPPPPAPPPAPARRRGRVEDHQIQRGDLDRAQGITCQVADTGGDIGASRLVRPGAQCLHGVGRTVDGQHLRARRYACGQGADTAEQVRDRTGTRRRQTDAAAHFPLPPAGRSAGRPPAAARQSDPAIPAPADAVRRSAFHRSCLSASGAPRSWVSAIPPDP